MTNDTNQTTLFDTPTTNGEPTTSTPGEERPGYQFVKRIGWIPEDWEMVELCELIQKGRPITYGIVQPGHPVNNGVMMIRGGDYSNGWVSESEIYKVSPEIEAPYERSRVKAADLIITVVGAGVGSVAVVPKWLDGQNLSRTVARLAIDSDKAVSDYVQLVLESDYGRHLVYKYQKGGAQPGLNIGSLNLFDLPLPPLPEQQKIARILGAWDRALADLDALIEARQLQKKGLAQRLLTGRVRLPGFEGRRVPMRPLSEFFRHFSKRNKEGRDLTALSCSKVHGIVPQTEIFDKRVASDDTSRYKIVKRGDLVYDPMLLWDASIGFSDAVDEGVISPAYATFHLNEETASRAFFRHFLDSHYMRHQYKVISQGTNKRRRKAMASDFLKVEARVPPLDEQRRIATVLDAADAEVAALEAQRDALARQKRGLMQRLLTGEVRVTPDPEDHAEPTSTP